MDENKPLGQEPSEKLKQLEQELEEIHKKATETYKDNKPHKFYQPLGQPSAPFPDVSVQGAQTSPSIPAGVNQTKPTYLEESQAATMTQHVKPDEKKSQATRPFIKRPGTGKLNVVFKIGLGLLGLALAVAAILFLIGRSTLSRKAKPTSWEECLQEEGSSIMESYPRVCITKTGERFIEPIQIETPTQTTTPTPAPTDDSSEGEVEEEGGAKEDCVITGCNSEICVDQASSDIVSICLYKPEYECYKQAICEKQTDGVCGWTQTEELQTCLEQY